LPHTVCIFEDKKFSNFFPLSLSQPVFDLRIGFHTLRSRMHDEFAGVELHTLCREYLADITRIKTPDVRVNELPEQETLYVNARLLCLGDELQGVLEKVQEANTVAVKGGYVVAARLEKEAAVDFGNYIRMRIGEESIAQLCEALRERGEESASKRTAEPAPAQAREATPSKKASIRKQDAEEGAPEDMHVVGEDAKAEKLPAALVEIIGAHNMTRVEMPKARLLSFPWQLIELNGDVITDDFNKLPFRGESEESVTYPGVHIINEDAVMIGEGAVVKSGAVLDATDGPIAIGDRTIVMPNACIVGPASIGADCIIRTGAKILPATSTGRVCKVGGEVEGTIISSYSNKQHDGFIGHSYLGEWVNIGAASNNSDLKNNYSAVRMWCAGAIKNTGRQFMGLIMGDHTKTGINTLFNTGTVVGFNCNIFSSELPGKFVPSFSWGHGTQMTEYDVEKAMQTASVVLERRKAKFTEAHRKIFAKIFEMRQLTNRNI
jgi:UDP-N-acetylglucosamine diphosphorylase/glucosamine-1-phosphate N-acetyltransferase